MSKEIDDLLSDLELENPPFSNGDELNQEDDVVISAVDVHDQGDGDDNPDVSDGDIYPAFVTPNIPELQDSRSATTKAIDALNVDAFLGKFQEQYETIVGGLDGDRSQMQDVVDILYERVNTGVASGSETESLVKLLQAKVDSNGHRVKLLDAMSKVMAATRNNVNTIINQNFSSDDDGDALAQVLKGFNEGDA